MICPVCKHENEDDVTFCVNCGMKLENSENPENTSEKEGYREEEKNRVEQEYIERQRQLERESEEIQWELRNQMEDIKQKGKRKRKILFIYGILASILMVVFFIRSIMLNSDYERMYNSYFTERNKRMELQKEYQSLEAQKTKLDELQTAYNKLSDEKEKWNNILPDIMVEVVNIYNSEKNLNVIGEKKTGLTGLKNEEIKYLSFDCNIYKVSSDVPETIELGIDIFTPKGKKVLKNTTDTHTMTKKLSISDDTETYSMGWGSNTSGYYGEGTYSILFYYGKEIVGYKTVILK